MKKQRIRDFGYFADRGPTGPLNKITDVPGVKVGHTTVLTENHRTGVTVIMPCPDNPFPNKLTAAAVVHNGFGKSAGLIQIEELGTLETPIALTNTLNVGRVHDALVDYMIEQCSHDGIELTSLNPVVGECNDSGLNQIQERVVGIQEVRKAIETACEDFEEGAVGAGAGTICFGLKGGIGSASRQLTFDGQTYTLGILVQSNFGRTDSFCLDGKKAGKEIGPLIEKADLDRGSIMMIAATDLPVSDRQLKRILRRTGIGLARCGSYMGHGSGDVAIGFTTANRIPLHGGDVVDVKILKEALLEKVFEAMADVTEEAVLNSLVGAETVTGYQGKTRYALTDIYEI